MANILEVCRIRHGYRRITADSMVYLSDVQQCDCWHHLFCRSSLFLVSNVLRCLQVSAISIAWLEDCSPLPLFPWVVEIQRALPLMAAILIFKCTEGAGVGDYSFRGRGALFSRLLQLSSQTALRPLSRFDTHLRWPPVIQSLRSRRSYEKIRDCDKSTWLDAGGSSSGASWGDRIYWSSRQPRIN